MSQKDYFIKESVINAYTINAFAEALVEATKQGLELDYDSARRIGSSFSISIKSQEETQVEAEETPADQTESVETQSADESPEEIEENPLRELPSETQPFTVDDIEAAKGSMTELNKLAEPAGISGRSKKDLVKQLKAYIGA